MAARWPSSGPDEAKIGGRWRTGPSVLARWCMRLNPVQLLRLPTLHCNDCSTHLQEPANGRQPFKVMLRVCRAEADAELILYDNLCASLARKSDPRARASTGRVSGGHSAPHSPGGGSAEALVNHAPSGCRHWQSVTSTRTFAPSWRVDERHLCVSCRAHQAKG